MFQHIHYLKKAGHTLIELFYRVEICLLRGLIFQRYFKAKHFVTACLRKSCSSLDLNRRDCILSVSRSTEKNHLSSLLRFKHGCRNGTVLIRRGLRKRKRQRTFEDCIIHSLILILATVLVRSQMPRPTLRLFKLSCNQPFFVLG